MIRLAQARFSVIIAAALMIMLALPYLARAQTSPNNDLSATIRAELLSDPRTSGLSQAQLNAMVDLLTQQAQKQGMTAHDITWRPQRPPAPAQTAPQMNGCGVSTFFCDLDEAFGFVGPDTTIPFALGATSMGLIWILAETLHRRRMGVHSKL